MEGERGEMRAEGRGGGIGEVGWGGVGVSANSRLSRGVRDAGAEGGPTREEYAAKGAEPS